MQSSHYLDPLEKLGEIVISNTRSEVAINCPWLIYYYYFTLICLRQASRDTNILWYFYTNISLWTECRLNGGVKIGGTSPKYLSITEVHVILQRSSLCLSSLLLLLESDLYKKRSVSLWAKKIKSKPTLWECNIERGNVTSHYHGSKIFGSAQ